MRIQAQHQTTATELSTHHIPSQLAPVSCNKPDTIVSAKAVGKPTSFFSKAWNSVKSLALRFWDWLKDLFNSCAEEELSGDIIQQMIDDPKGYAAEFVKDFDANWNSLIREAYDDPKKFKEKLTDKTHKKELKEFFVEVKNQLEKTPLSNNATLMDQVGEMRAVVREASSGIAGRLDLTKFAPRREFFKSNIAKVVPVLMTFFDKVKAILKSGKEAKEQSSLEALVLLFGNYFPSVVNEMKNWTQQPHKFDGFIEAFFNLQSIDKDAVIALFKKEFPAQTEDKEDVIAALTLCLENDGEVLNDKVISERYSKDLGLKNPVNYKMTLLEAMSPEQFEKCLGMFVKDPNRMAIMINLFKEIKSLDEPITFNRLNDALDNLDDLLGSFESGSITIS